MRSPSWIRAARSGLSFPHLPPLARFVNPQPGLGLAARIQNGDLITNSGFFDHPTACGQANPLYRHLTPWVTYHCVGFGSFIHMVISCFCMFQRVMQVPDERESFTSDSEPEPKCAVKSSHKRDKPPSPVDSSTPKHEQRGEKIAKREAAHLAQIKHKPKGQLEKVEPDERKK